MACVVLSHSLIRYTLYINTPVYKTLARHSTFKPHKLSAIIPGFGFIFQENSMT